MEWYTNAALCGLFCLLWAMFALALLAHWALLRTPGPDKRGRAGKGEGRATRKSYGGEQTHRQLGIHRVNGTP